MGSNEGAIENKMFHIGVIRKVLMQLVPNILIIPTGKAFVDAIPVTVLCRL